MYNNNYIFKARSGFQSWSLSFLKDLFVSVFLQVFVSFNSIGEFFSILKVSINSFYVTGIYTYTTWKHQETSGFLIFFSGYRKRLVACNVFGAKTMRLNSNKRLFGYENVIKNVPCHISIPPENVRKLMVLNILNINRGCYLSKL